jgi:YesN/AraC family two-component response regulator
LSTLARKLDLVITDYVMPSMTGEELICHVRETHPVANASQAV